MQTTTTPETILALEEQLLQAFSSCHLDTLDTLLHDSVLFVIPTGEVLTKTRVLNNYRSGNSAMSTIAASEQVVSLVNDTAVVAMILELKGKYNQTVIHKTFRYLRTWKRFDASWQVIAVSGVPL